MKTVGWAKPNPGTSQNQPNNRQCRPLPPPTRFLSPIRQMRFHRHRHPIRSSSSGGLRGLELKLRNNHRNSYRHCRRQTFNQLNGYQQLVALRCDFSSKPGAAEKHLLPRFPLRARAFSARTDIMAKSPPLSNIGPADPPNELLSAHSRRLHRAPQVLGGNRCKVARELLGRDLDRGSMMHRSRTTDRPLLSTVHSLYFNIVRLVAKSSDCGAITLR